LSSPLLNDNDIEGANYILLNISSGSNEVMMDEITEITDYIQDEAGLSADIIWGTGVDEELGDSISITLIATGFQANKSIGGIQSEKKKAKVVHSLSTEKEVENVIEPSSELEPTIKNSEPEQIEMNLDVQIVEKKQDSDKKEVVVSDNTEPAKIVHNLYDDEAFHNVTSSESEKESPTFEFEAKESEDEYTEQPASFKPNFVSQEPINVNSESDLTSSTFADELDSEERAKRSQDRLNQLNNLSRKMKTPSGINDLENEPAYLRRSVKLDSVNHSSETNVSRFTLGDDGDNNPEIRSNNSFLHDNVD